jgi:iron complex outermembrane receptor protein
MLRGTVGDAYKVPSLIDLTRPTSRQSQNFGATGSFVLFDTERNEQVLGPVVNVTGGNPNLLPEESRNETWGVLFEPPVKFLRGLSLGINHSDIKILNRVGSVSYQERLAFRPDMFVRAAPSAADTAAGLPGKITEVDNRSINIAYFRSAAFDYQLRYSRKFARAGSFDLNANVTKQDKYEAIPRPGLPPTTTTNNILRPLRGVASLDWNKWGLGLGATAVYQEGYRTSATSASTATRSTLLWHARASYSFDQGELHARGGRLDRWTRGLRLNVAVQNLLNEEPSFTTTGAASGAIDPRLRRYVISVRKTL